MGLLSSPVCQIKDAHLGIIFCSDRPLARKGARGLFLTVCVIPTWMYGVAVRWYVKSKHLPGRVVGQSATGP